MILFSAALAVSHDARSDVRKSSVAVARVTETSVHTSELSDVGAGPVRMTSTCWLAVPISATVIVETNVRWVFTPDESV